VLPATQHHDLQEALRLTGLKEGRFRFLEKEFGRCLGIEKMFFAPSVYTNG
jgi:hypothetical protein